MKRQAFLTIQNEGKRKFYVKVRERLSARGLVGAAPLTLENIFDIIKEINRRLFNKKLKGKLWICFKTFRKSRINFSILQYY